MNYRLLFRFFTLALLITTACVPAPPRPSPTTWSFIGPTHSSWDTGGLIESSGRVRDIAIDPAGTIYIATSGGGVWKRVGAGWQPLTDDAATLQAHKIVIDPSDARTIYVGTGGISSLDSYHGAGILKSIDGGATWTHIAGPFMRPPRSGQGILLGQSDGGARIMSLAISPTDRRVLLAGVYNHAGETMESAVYRSPDAGLTWTPVLTGNVANVLFFHPASGDTAYAAFASPFGGAVNGVYRSSDGGLTWAPLMGTGADTLRTRRWQKVTLAMAPSDPRVLYISMSAADSAPDHLLGVYKSEDGGAHWNRLANAPDYCAGWCHDWNVLGVHPRDASMVFAGGAVIPLHRSFDGGETWERVTIPEPTVFHPDVSKIAFSNGGDTMLVGTDGGIIRSTTYRDAIPSWSAINDDLGNTMFYPGFYVHQESPNFIVAGTQDNDVAYWTGLYTWRVVQLYEGPHVTFDPVSGRMFRFARGAARARGVFRIMPTPTRPGVGEPHGPMWAPIALDPRDGNIQYAATNRVYRTIDAQTTWTPISPVLTGDTYSHVSSLVVARSDREQVCAGTSNGRVWCTRNARAGAPVWTDVGAGGALPARYVMEVAIHPLRPERIGIAFSGYRTALAATGGHVYVSDDRGGSWRDITGNLPDEPVNAITFDAWDTGEAIVAATDAGVFRMRDDRPLWAHIGQGLPNAVTVGVGLHERNRVLYVPTMGRSMWQLAVPVLTRAPGPTIALSALQLRFTVRAGEVTPAQVLTIRNAGSAVFGSTPLRWNGSVSTADGRSWLGITATSGVDDGTLGIIVDARLLTPGFYNGVVTITGAGATNGPEKVTILVEVLP